MDRVYLDAVGQFECVVEKPDAGWFGESSEKQTPFVRIPVRVTEGPHQGKCIAWKGWMSDAAVDNTVSALTKAFGFNGDWNALHTGRLTFADLPCNITTESEVYEGKTRIKAKWLNPAGGGGMKPMDEAKVKSIIAKLTPRSKAVAKAAQLELGTSNPQPPAPSATGGQPATTEAPAEDDDVPF